MLAELIPDAVGWFAGDKAEKAAAEVLDIASSVTGISDKDEALKAIQSDPEVALKFKIAVMNDKHRLDEMFLEDRKDARDMQKSALEQDDVFSKRFIYYFAIGWSTFAALYMTGITFLPVSEAAQGYSNTILGFLLGTAVSGIMQFFYGSSQGSKEKTLSQNKIIDATQGVKGFLTKGK
ncbi:hypothetical protein VPHG_00161 [Vibrio phage 11895-B1]|uniref:hypothetical protein n=1 Tax=Vibrio phage 11895-B1 TaxID=754075 RepID=UPI0002C0E59D|nr:hypothetical protein VPHG_00161 [Vibrio phage 11895-B1]AGH32224.1 hypothetical protein VPHG_00161 [Vibrio phage 11895-B1]